MDQHLKDIDNEINAAYEMCVKGGYSHEEIQKFAQPVLQPIVRERRKRALLATLTTLAKVLLVIGVATLVTYVIEANDNYVTEKIGFVFRLTSRAVLMKILPFWDWTKLYDSECLIDNPYFSGSGLVKADCESCERLRQVAHTNKLAHEEYMQKYVTALRPVIVDDAMVDWPVMKKAFNIEEIFKWYLDDKNIENVCHFQSNHESGTSRELLQKIKTGELKNVTAQWVNCQKEAIKHLRKYYNRPYFGSEAVEFTGNSWIILSSSYEMDDFKHLNISDPDMIAFVAQVRGESKIKLRPRKPCNSSCNILIETLKEGDIISIPIKMWKADYVLHSDTDNFMVLLTAFG